MKLNIRRRFRHTDDLTAQRIADLCPPVDETTRDRIFQSAVKRIHQPVMQAEDTFQVASVHPVRWRRIAAAAACAAVVGTAAIGIGMQAGSGRSELPQERLTTSNDTGTKYTNQETTQIPTETTATKEWTQQAVYDLCLQAAANLEKPQQVSGQIDMQIYAVGMLQSYHSQGKFAFDCERDFYSAEELVLDGSASQMTDQQQNHWYYAEGAAIQLTEYPEESGLQDTASILEAELPEPLTIPAITSTCIVFPDELTKLYLSDFSLWHITGTEPFRSVSSVQMPERECIVIEGSRPSSGTGHFQIRVDAETGMWLSFEDFTADGELSHSIYMTELRTGEAADIVQPYTIGEKLRRGEYAFDTDFSLDDLPEVYQTQPEETTAPETTARCLDQSNLLTEGERIAADLPVPTDPTETAAPTSPLTEMTTTTTTASGLTEEQQKQLEALRAEGDRLFGVFVRQEKILMGLLPADAPRLTLAQMEEIIGNSADFEEIMENLTTRHHPDFIGGSGVTNIRFWLDAAGTEQILIILEQGDIWYVHPDGETVILWD